MSADRPTLQTLGRALCPWLGGHFAQLEAARHAGRLGHAWLLAGPPGIGKINLALVMAHRLLADGARAVAPPVLTAADAASVLPDRHRQVDHHPDLHCLFPLEDKRTISVDQIRDVSEALVLTSLRGGAKVLLIEPAEAMTVGAANALLKTLEEPTAETYLWLVSHQPGRLPATIRSRCQTVAIARPAEAHALKWLESVPGAETLLALASGSPFLALELERAEFNIINNELSKDINAIYRNEADPQAIAAAWIKRDCEKVLSWLIRHLQLAIRARSAPPASKCVTDPGSEILHNAWSALTLRDLFEQLRSAEQLLSRLSGGINAELALAVLLLGFQSRDRDGVRTGSTREMT